MGFRTVYRYLMELFPQIDAKVLRGIAIEHQHDANEAAAVVISEICPLSSSNFTPPWNKNKNILEDSQDVKGNTVEPDMQSDDKSLSLSQWLQPSKLPHSYLALLNEESTPDVEPPLNYVVEKVVLPRYGAGTGAGGPIRTMSASEKIGASSLVKPSIRVQSRTNNELFVSISNLLKFTSFCGYGSCKVYFRRLCQGNSSKAPVGRRSSRKCTKQKSLDYSKKLRSWKNRSNNYHRDYSQLYGKYTVPWKQSNKNKYRCSTSERERKQRIDDNIKALGELLPYKAEEDNQESTLNAIVAHVKLLHLQMKELSRSRLGGQPSHPMTFLEGYGHYIHHEKRMTKSLEDVMEDLFTNDFDAAATLLGSKGLYLMPLSSVQGLC